MTLFLATSNLKKIEEFKKLFLEANLNITVKSAEEVGCLKDVEETELTFSGNAKLKAHACYEALKLANIEELKSSNWWVLADDSGLEVNYLNGAPGIFSARYAAENIETSKEKINISDANNQKLLRELVGIPLEKRQARFVCCLILISNEGREVQIEETCEGHIALKISGTAGFGYDPLFVPNGYDQTFSELGSQIKGKISHRAKALKKIIEILSSPTL